MTAFKGFPPGKGQTISIHAQFISDVIPHIQNVETLKLCLFCYHALLQKEGRFRYLTREDFTECPLDNSALDAALADAVEIGFLLAQQITLDSNDTQTLYFMNTAKGRTAAQQLAAGNWQPSLDNTVDILPERPTVFALYEENIGALTPMIAEHLKAAMNDYDYQWVADAIEIATLKNARNWKYISAILTRWKEEGRADHETTGRHSERNEYAGLNWSDFATE